MVSCDADVARASQLQHTVQDVDSNCHFGCLTLVGLRAQRMTDDPFPAAYIGFHQGTPVVLRRFLPTHAAMFGNGCRCQSRGVGAVSAVSLGTAFERGGTMTAASG